MQNILPANYNCIIILGPTAVGKTGLAVKLADYFSAQIISADSRQVYRNLDIGSGKDLEEFILNKGKDNQKEIKYHLIDIVDVNTEYSVFDYQKDFYKVFTELQNENILPVIVGGTGMYLDAIVRGYDLLQVPVNNELRKELQGKSIQELIDYLVILKTKSGIVLHNQTDITERHRLLRAIEIEVFNQSEQAKIEREKMPCRPKINPIILGTTFERQKVRSLVTERLQKRMEQGLIEEVQSIHDSGTSWERLERLGLEYRYVSEFLQNKILTKEELFQKLNTAIHQFVKRQETWFRGMERKGVSIHWLTQNADRLQDAIKYIESLN